MPACAAGDRGWAEHQGDKPRKVARVTALHNGKDVSGVSSGLKGMKQMMEAGLIHAGKGVITHNYKGEESTADLREDGVIVCKVGLLLSPLQVSTQFQKDESRFVGTLPRS